MNEAWRIAPVLIVGSVTRAMDYYVERLGFEVKGTFGDPIEMAFVGRGGVQIMLQDGEGRARPGPNAAYKSVAWDALFWVEDAAALHGELTRRGARLSRGLHETSYRTREVHALDLDDHVLSFCQLL